MVYDLQTPWGRSSPQIHGILIGFSGFPLFSPSILGVKAPYFFGNTHIIGDSHQPNRGLYAHYKEFLLKVGSV